MRSFVLGNFFPFKTLNQVISYIQNEDLLPYKGEKKRRNKEFFVNKFEDIMKLQPDWYMGRPLTLDGFNNFADTMQQVSMPSVENGGIRRSSGGGGGFVGGGHGGGGGGSW